MSRTPVVTQLVPITQPSGAKLNAQLVLDRKPTRQQMKLTTLRKYVQQHPRGWKKRLELAELLYTMGHWQAAIEQYQQVLDRQPYRLDVQLQLGKILHLMGRDAEAIALYEQTLQSTRQPATIHHIQGLIALCRQQEQAASTAFQAATRLEPNNVAHWSALAQTQLKLDCTVAALKALEQIVQRHPDDVIVLTQRYEPLIAVGAFQMARQSVERAVELAPEHVPALKHVAEHRCRLRLVAGEEGKQTRKLLRTILRLAPDSAEVHRAMAYYHLHRGEWKQGVTELKQFVDVHPNSPNGWYYYAQCLIHTGDAASAVEAILNAHALYSQDGEICRALCEILPAAGRSAQLQPFMQVMLRRFPQHWRIWTAAGRIKVEQCEDIELGCQHSARVLQLKPRLADAWFQHGQVLAIAGRPQDAIQTLETGWQWLPDPGGALQAVPAAVCLGEQYAAVGNVAMRQHWLEIALDRTQQLLEFCPAIAHYWHGKILEIQGERDGAISVYRRALHQQLLYPARAQVDAALSQLCADQ